MGDKDCLIIDHYKPPSDLDKNIFVVNSSCPDNIFIRAGRTTYFNAYDARMYHYYLQESKVKSQVKKHFSNLISCDNEKNVRGIKRCGYHLLLAKALHLQERGVWYDKEIGENAYSFFEKKLVKSKLSREQYQKWYGETVDMVELFRSLLKNQISTSDNNSSTAYVWGSDPDFTESPTSDSASATYISQFLPSEIEIKLMENTSFELKQLLRYMKLYSDWLSEGRMFYQGRWVEIIR